MNDKKLTAEEIFALIDSKSVSKEMGVNLIKNYGIRQQQNSISALQDDHPAYSEKITKTINELNERLDGVLKSVIEVTN